MLRVLCVAIPKANPLWAVALCDCLAMLGSVQFANKPVDST